MASERQVAANRQNGLKGGVKTEEGKAISRLNARKHSIFVTALTAEDSEEVCGYEDQLIASLRPAGRVEEMLVEKLALTWLRMQRCARAEAEYHTQTCGDPVKVESEYRGWDNSERKRRYAATGMCFNEKVFEHMVKLIDLYDSRLTNQFLKLLHEIERLQLLRKGEGGAAALQDKRESGSGVAEVANAVKPPPASADGAPASAATETSCPPSQPLSFVPPPITDDLDTGGVAQPAEQAPAPAPEKSQDAAAQRADAPEAI
jgi:hypothetical protein